MVFKETLRAEIKNCIPERLGQTLSSLEGLIWNLIDSSWTHRGSIADGNAHCQALLAREGIAIAR